jgi:ferredoxin
VLWLAVIGWKLQRRERAYGVNRNGARGPAYTARGPAAARGPAYGPRGIPRAPRWDDDASEWDDDEPRWDEDSPDRDDRPPYEAGKPGRRSIGQAPVKRAEVEINPGKCMRFAFCEHEAPEVFQLKGDRIDYKPTVPPDQIDAVAMAVKVCPARAIRMKTPGSKPYLPQPPVNDDERRPVRR